MNWPKAYLAQDAELVALRRVREAAEKYIKYTLTHENRDVFLSMSSQYRIELRAALQAAMKGAPDAKVP